MHRYTNAFCTLLDHENIRYNCKDNLVMVGYTGDSKRSYDFGVCFPDADDSQKVSILSRIGDAPFTGEKYAKALVLCNNNNNERAFVRLYVNNEKIVFAQYDFVLHSETNIDDITNIIIMMGNAIDEVYPDFMKIMWS